MDRTMAKVKLSDWVAQKVSEAGVRHVFMVTGGGAMHLNHSLGMHPDLTCVFNHHEQACTMAAESYFRYANDIALVNVTTGPGGTNAITGVYGAYVDSVGMVVLSGQVKRETTVRHTGLPLRQFGDQEIDIEYMIRSVTKYSAMVTDPQTIRYHLEKAFHLARSGRPGPTWLDIPLDVQGAYIDPDTLPGYDPSEQETPWEETDIALAVSTIATQIGQARRPVILAGTGVRLSGQYDAFLSFAEKAGIPVVGGWNAQDILTNDHPLYCGRPSTIGDRGGNFTIQNADLLVVLGCRLNIRQISYNWGSFAPNAKKIWVDIDEMELRKPSIKPDTPILADLRALLPALAAWPWPTPSTEHTDWLEWCRQRVAKYPVVLPEYYENDKVNPYCFVKELFESLPENQIVIAANATAAVVGFQAAIFRQGQRMWSNSGCASMGYDLPAAIGAYEASGREVICLAGDGSIMMNLQELQTIASNRMPIKIFLLNNAGYVSIFQTQHNFFNGEEIGAGPSSGVVLPDFEALTKGFRLPYRRIESHEGMNASIKDFLAIPGPAVCEIILDENQPFAPKLASRQLEDGTIVSSSFEDLAPFLSREELASNMLEP
ncbi:MAG: thiamine pyrophosphate-binding protein [Acetobacter papayae]